MYFTQTLIEVKARKKNIDLAIMLFFTFQVLLQFVLCCPYSLEVAEVVIEIPALFGGIFSEIV